MTSPLRRLAAALDDAALEALAPRGLIRRAAADFAAGQVTLDTEADQRAELSVDGQKVVLDAKSATAGGCDCPAAGMCRHRLSALIYLRETHQTPAPQTSGSDDPSAELPEPDWSDLARSFTATALARFAGTGSWREALSRQSEARTAEVIPQSGALQVRLSADEEPVVFLASGGLEAALVRGPAKHRKLKITLAAIAVRQALGQPDLEAAEPTAPAAVGGSGLDLKLLEQAQDLLRRLYRAALTFAPRSLEQEALKLALAGRVDDLPRLAAALRGIAASMAAVREREANADSSDLLVRITETFALTTALANAAPNPGPRLTGEARQAYRPIGDLQFFGLGAQRWETSGGARGVTAWLHAPSLDRTFTVTEARAAGLDPDFDPQTAFDTSAVWGHSLRRLSLGDVRVQAASASADGRLSHGSATQARVVGSLPSPEAARGWSCAYDDWGGLESALRDQFSPALTAPRRGETVVILFQSTFAPVMFDELTQTLTWPLADAHGRWIGLTLPYLGLNQRRIRTLERLAKQKTVQAVLALASVEAGRIALNPYAIWDDGIHMLDFQLARDWRPDRPAAGNGLLDRLLAQRHQNRPTPLTLALGSDATGRALDDAWARVLKRAELGRTLNSSTSDADVQSVADRLEALGLVPVARSLAAAASLTDEDAALAAAWAIHTARQSRIRLPWLHPA